MLSSPASYTKRSRDEDETSPAKRSRTFGEYDLQITTSVPQLPAFGHFGQPPQQQQQYNDSVGCDMDMEDSMQMDQMSQMASGQGQGWTAAHGMQFSNSNCSSATSTSPATPIEEYDEYAYEDDDEFGDNTYARPTPFSCYPSPEQHASTFTNHNGVTSVFADGATSTMTNGSTYTQYVYANQKQPEQQFQQPQQSYGWNMPQATFGTGSHLV